MYLVALLTLFWQCFHSSQYAVSVALCSAADTSLLCVGSLQMLLVKLECCKTKWKLSHFIGQYFFSRSHWSHKAPLVILDLTTQLFQEFGSHWLPLWNYLLQEVPSGPTGEQDCCSIHLVSIHILVTWNLSDPLPLQFQVFLLLIF